MFLLTPTDTITTVYQVLLVSHRIAGTVPHTTIAISVRLHTYQCNNRLTILESATPVAASRTRVSMHTYTHYLSCRLSACLVIIDVSTTLGCASSYVLFIVGILCLIFSLSFRDLLCIVTSLAVIQSSSETVELHVQK